MYAEPFGTLHFSRGTWHRDVPIHSCILTNCFSNEIALLLLNPVGHRGQPSLCKHCILMDQVINPHGERRGTFPNRVLRAASCNTASRMLIDTPPPSPYGLVGRPPTPTARASPLSSAVPYRRPCPYPFAAVHQLMPGDAALIRRSEAHLSARGLGGRLRWCHAIGRGTASPGTTRGRGHPFWPVTKSYLYRLVT